jgi:hypothetical protein
MHIILIFAVDVKYITSWKMRSALFWNTTQRIVVIPRPTFRDNPSVPSRSSNKYQNLDFSICCPQTSARNYHHTLGNIPEERISHLHRGGSLNSRIIEDS